MSVLNTLFGILRQCCYNSKIQIKIYVNIVILRLDHKWNNDTPQLTVGLNKHILFVQNRKKLGSCKNRNSCISRLVTTDTAHKERCCFGYLICNFHINTKNSWHANNHLARQWQIMSVNCVLRLHLMVTKKTSFMHKPNDNCGIS